MLQAHGQQALGVLAERKAFAPPIKHKPAAMAERKYAHLPANGRPLAWKHPAPLLAPTDL